MHMTIDNPTFFNISYEFCSEITDILVSLSDFF